MWGIYGVGSAFGITYFVTNDYNELGAVGLVMIMTEWLWSIIDAPSRAAVINHRYNLIVGYDYDGDKIGLKIEPYFATQTACPGMHINQTFPVYGARMSITIK